MQSRIENPVMTYPRALKGLQLLGEAAKQAGLPRTTALLVELRASQINGCSVCVDMHSRELRHGARPRTSPTPSAPPLR
jgi:AhpD family alkylhydroperoxidase